MLESRRCYGYGMVSPDGHGYDYIIKKRRVFCRRWFTLQNSNGGHEESKEIYTRM